MKKAFLERNQWIIFRSVMQDDVLDGCDGVLVASKPATKKGTTGWAAFPGKQRKKSLSPQPPLFSCLQSNTPPHEHYAGQHSGYCLKFIDVTSKNIQNQISKEVSLIVQTDD